MTRRSMVFISAAFCGWLTIPAIAFGQRPNPSINTDPLPAKFDLRCEVLAGPVTNTRGPGSSWQGWVHSGQKIEVPVHLWIGAAVWNSGFATTDNVPVSVVLEIDGNPVNLPVPKTIAPIAGGQSRYAVESHLSFGTSPRDQTPTPTHDIVVSVRATVDGPNMISEANETNNKCSDSFSIVHNTK